MENFGSKGTTPRKPGNRRIETESTIGRGKRNLIQPVTVTQRAIWGLVHGKSYLQIVRSKWNELLLQEWVP